VKKTRITSREGILNVPSKTKIFGRGEGSKEKGIKRGFLTKVSPVS